MHKNQLTGRSASLQDERHSLQLRDAAPVQLCPSFVLADQEKFDPVRFSEIARVFLVRPIIPMLMYTQAAASDAVAFGIIERLRRWIVRQSRLAQVVIGIRQRRSYVVDFANQASCGNPASQPRPCD
jgi:hypothetical protein